MQKESKEGIHFRPKAEGLNYESICYFATVNSNVLGVNPYTKFKNKYFLTFHFQY